MLIHEKALWLLRRRHGWKGVLQADWETLDGKGCPADIQPKSSGTLAILKVVTPDRWMVYATTNADLALESPEIPSG